MAYDPNYYFKEYGPPLNQLSISMLQLDPADRAVHIIADQRDAVQKKTFTKWVNKHLLKAGRRIVDLFEGFKDGHNLLSLLEVLSHETLPRERGRLKFHSIQNVQIALEFLRRKGIRLVNIRSDEIVDGNPKLTLGLVWTIILHFQVSDVVVPGQPEDITAKDALLLWSRRMTDGYPGVQVQNFTNCWSDGKAFLSIIHRNRPELVDFRKVQTQTNRQNLELAFSTAEREFGVTRLLDPEDVDVARPDEKSIITYVSSLYEQFPEVPSVEQSLKDNERQLKMDEYRELAFPLVSWLQDVILMFSERNFPTTLIEMKSLLTDLNRFRIEDVPPRLEMRKKMLKLFDEIQSTGASHLSADDELYPDNVSRLWNRLEHTVKEREMAIQSEIVRLERFQRLAEKIHRESKHCDDSLNDLDRRIQAEERHVETLHPFEAKRNCDALDRALKNVEDNVQSLLRDAQALQDGRYVNADAIYRRVSGLVSRVSQVRNDLYTNIIQKLVSKSYVEDNITTSRRREVVTEVRLVENNPAFRHVQHCLNWIEAKHNALEDVEYGSDLVTIQMNHDKYKEDHLEVTGFKKEIDKCINDRVNLSPDEQDLYTEWLSKVEVGYSLLHNTSSRRMKSLESLLDFIQAATQEIIWLNEKEKAEVTRDWSSSRLNVPSVEEFYKNLLYDLKGREAQFNSVQDRGNSMVLDRHPASQTIEAYMSEMQSQWSWLLQLSICLDAHVKHTSAFYQFFEEAQECEQWMSRQADSINIRYSDDSQSVETLQQLLKELQDLSDQVTEYERRVSSLTVRSREIIPLKQRGQPVFSELRCRCLCIYKQPPMVLQRDEEVVLLDNSQKIRWRIRTGQGQEDLVPSVCISIPPPNYEAIEFADRLKIQLDHLQSLLRMRKRKLRHNMVLGTISLIQGWDLAQFQALDPIRREALLRALNDDATKLIAEVGEGDREIRQLREKLNECNQHFNKLSTAISAEELRRSRGPDKEFIQKLDSVSYQLSSLDQNLQMRTQQPLPHDKQTIDAARKQQSEWEKSLQNQEGAVEHVRLTYNQLGQRSPQVDAKINFIDDKWTQMITLGNSFAERLRMNHSVLTKLENLEHVVGQQEVALGNQDNLSSDPSVLKSQLNELQSILSTLDAQEPVLDSLAEDERTLREMLEKSRPGTARHHDLEDLEKKMEQLTNRWKNLKEQGNSRLQSVQNGDDSLSQYTNGYLSEQQFVAEVQNKINSQPTLTSNIEDAKKLVQPTMAIYNSLGEHQHQIENANRHGGQFIREAKIFQKKLKSFTDQMETGESGTQRGLHVHSRKVEGAETVKTELDALNRQYIDQVLWANKRLKQIQEVFADANIDIQFPMLVTERMPLLRTFRAELTKRSSMLVDEDMQEFFQQLEDYEGYGGLQAMGRTGQTFGSQTGLNTNQLEPTSAVQVSATVLQNPPSTLTMRMSPMSSETLTQKVASMTSLSVMDTDDLGTVGQPGQVLITVKQGCLAPKGTCLHNPSILNARTGRKMNLVDSMKAGIFDIKTGTIIDQRTNRKMNLAQAVANKYTSNELQKQLSSRCGLKDPYSGRECTLLEAIQKNIFCPQNITVKDSTSDQYISLQEAIARGLISKDDALKISGDGVTVTFITQSQTIYSDEEFSNNTTRLSVGDIIELGLYIPQTGKMVDPITGNEMSLLEAVERGLVNPTRKEIKDVNSGKWITLIDAVTNGIIDPESGTHINKQTGQKLTLDDAYQRRMVSKPLVLPKAVKDGVLLENGRVCDFHTGRVVTLKEAVDLGVIDSDSKCVVDSNTGEILTIVEALSCGLLDYEGCIHPYRGANRESVLDSLDAGHIKMVQEDLSFGKLCVRDTRSGKLLTVFQAIKQGIITSNGDFVDTSSGRRILLKAAAGQGFVEKEISDILLKDISVRDSSNRQVSILKAIQIGIIVPDKAEIRDPNTRKPMKLQQAIKEGIISTEDAQVVLEILSPAIVHTTITTRLQPGNTEAGIRSISISDAITRGLLSEETGTFRDPNTGSSVPVQTAIECGLLRLSSEWPTNIREQNETNSNTLPTQKSDMERWMREVQENPEVNKELRTKGQATVESKVRKADGDYSFTQTIVTKPKVQETFVAETKHFQVKSVVDPRTKREISLSEAVHRGLLDMQEGIFIHPVTEERMTIENALSRGFVRGIETSESVPGTSMVTETKSFAITGVIHPKTGQRISISQAVKEHILDLDKGLYMGVDAKGRNIKLKISEAVEKGFVLADENTNKQGGDLKHETKTYQLKSVVNPLTRERLDVAEAIKQGLLDEHKGIYINPKTGEKLTIPEAIERKLIDAELMSVVSNEEGEGSKIITTKMTTLMVKFVIDPRTGESISVHKAVEDGILDHAMENYINPLTGEVMTLNDAIDKKLVIAQTTSLEESMSGSTESIHIDVDEDIVDSSMTEEVTTETVTFSIGSVIDPRTMEMMSYDEAVLYGVLDVSRGLYINPMTRETTPIKIALEKGLIHGEVTSKTKAEDLMKSSVEARHLSFPVKKISSVIDPRDGSEIALDKAVKDGIVDLEKGTYFDVGTIENIPLEEAHKKGFIKLSKATDANEIERMRLESQRRGSEKEKRHLSSENGLESQVDMKMEKFGVVGNKEDSVFPDEVLNYTTSIENNEHNGKMELHDKKGLKMWQKEELAVVEPVSSTTSTSRSDSPMDIADLAYSDGLSYKSAQRLGIIDPLSGKIRDPKTGKYMNINEAIEKDIIDKHKPAMKDILTGKEMSLQECIDKQIIDPATGKINEKRAKAEKATLIPDLELKKTKNKSLNLIDCVGVGLFDDSTDMFIDPKSNKRFTLADAVSNGLIDGNLVCVNDPSSGEKMPLETAIRQGLIDGVTAEVINPYTDEKIPLMQAIQQGLVENVFDRTSCTVHDTLTGKDVPLDKALTEGFIKPNEARILDTSTGDSVPLDVAMRKGILDVRTGAVTDKMTGKKMSPQEALKLGLLAVVGAPVLAGKVVYDAIKSKAECDSDPIIKTKPVAKGIASVDTNGSPERKQLNGAKTRNGVDYLDQPKTLQLSMQKPKSTIVYAKPGDVIIPSQPSKMYSEPEEYRQLERDSGQLADSYEKLVQDLHNELNWISDTEQLLKEDQPVSEEAYKAQSQLEALKALHDDVLRHQQPIRSLVYQSEQLVEHHQEELTPEQVTELQNLESAIKVSYGKIQKTCDSRVKHLTAAADELSKFETELTKFSKWLGTSDNELQRQIEAVEDFDNIRRITELQKELSGDIVAHGADLRYLSFSVSKYMEESKVHKLELDAYKVDRQKPSRLSRTSWIAMDNREVEMVKDKQKEAETTYADLKARCNTFGEKMSQLAAKQKEFNDGTWSMLSWLTDAEEKLSMTRQEVSAPEPEALRTNLEKMKLLGNDSIAHKNHMADLEKSGKDLIAQMKELGIGGEQIEKIEEIKGDISGRMDIVSEEISERANELQTAVTKSQGVQDAMDQLLGWLKETDRKLDLQKPVSLNRDKLNGQAQQLSIIDTDIESHKPSIESVKQAASELIKTCDIDMAKSLEAKISDIGAKFLNAQKQCRNSSKEVGDVIEQLNKFDDKLDSLKSWVQANTDSFESSEWTRRPIDQLKAKVDDVKVEKSQKLKELEDLQALGHDLIEDQRTGDPAAVKMALTKLEQAWGQFDESLARRDSEASQKEQSEKEYDAIKNEVVAWLSNKETEVDTWVPVAVDMDIVARQIEELQPMIQEYYEFSPRIDELNEVGNAYDAIQSGDNRPKSPMRFRSRRVPSNVLSPRLRSPSPTTGSFSFNHSGETITSPMSSESSGVGSRKSSSDYLQLDDLSETQQDILDMNQRYEMLEERLLDRQQELQGMLGTVKSFLQDLADLVSWLDMKERDVDETQSVAASEKEAKRRLKDHERSHAELLSKETMVDDIRKKGHDLMKRKHGVPGIGLVKDQLDELDDKWLGVKVASEQQRKFLEDIVNDLRTYKDAGVTLQKWIAQKEKMVSVLGPVATDPSMVKNQLEQVQVLQEELRCQEPLYDKFIQSGNAVHDKCIPESKDASHISEKMTVISKSWDRLSDRLHEREKSLTSVEGLSTDFTDKLQELSNWTSDYMTTVDNLKPVSTSLDKHAEQLKEIKELEKELKEKVPQIEKVKELAKKLSDSTKDANTKFELRNKIASIEKPLSEAERKLIGRTNDISKMSEAGDKFRASCQDLLALIDDLKDKQAAMDPVSGDADVMRKQAQDNKAILKEVRDIAPEIRDVVEKAKQFGTSSSPAMKSVVDTVKVLQAEWTGIKVAAEDREAKLTESTKHAQNFQAQLDKMALWLQLNEAKLEGLNPDTVDQEVVAKKLREAEGMRGDVLKFSYDHELLNREGQSLIDAVDSDKGVIRVRLEDLNQRWENLNEGLGEKIQSLEDLSGKMTEVDDYTKDLNGTLKKLEDKLDAHAKMGSSAKDPKYQDKIASIKEDVLALGSQIDYVDGVIRDLDEGDGLSPQDKVQDLERTRTRQSDLLQQLNDLLQDMEAGTQIVDEYRGNVKSASNRLAELESEFANMSPIARDENALRVQQREIEEYISQLNDADNILEDLENQYATLHSDGIVTKADDLFTQLEVLHSQHDKLRENSEERKEEIKKIANDVEAVADNLRRMRTSIDRAADELEMHEPIGSDVNAIKRLQDELKQFQHGVFENLTRRVQGVSSEAQQLIQSAAPGVDTSGLEADLEHLMDKWNSLNAKVSERDRNLDNAILQSGKFNDALRNLLDWLKEMEDLVANQKPASPDYKVAKAQLQEQKFLLKMLEDRGPSVKSVQDSGDTLQKNLEARERQAIQNQISHLDKRWEDLNVKAKERSKTLEDIVKVSQSFQDVQDPVVTWLDQSEKKFASLEPTAMDADGIENIITSLVDLEHEVKDKDEQVKTLATVGKELQNHCKGDDVKNVQRKIDDVQSRYGELNDKITDTLEQMEEALPLAKSFSDAHAKFIDWIVTMEPKVRQKDANEPEEQVNQLLENLKEIEPVLEVMAADGNQLAELAPGDAGFKVEDTLSRNQKRFDAVNESIQNKADKFRASRLKSAETKCTVDDLIEWFDEEEKLIKSLEPISCEPAKLQKQLADQKATNDDINAQKTKARDTLATAKRFLREGSIDDDKDFTEKLDTLKQKSDAVAKMGSDRLVQLEQAMPLSKTFLEAHQDLLKWFEEVDPAIAELEVMTINQDTVKKQQDRVKVLKQDIQDNKPLIDKLNRSGQNLLKMVLTADDLDLVQSTMADDNKHVEEIRRAVRERSMSIDEALQQSAEFTDKLENMLETLTSTDEQITNAAPVSAHPDKIREQMAENNALMEEMQMKLTALESVQTAAEELIKQASDSQDEAVKDVKGKLKDLVELYEKISDAAQERNNRLEDTLEVSDKFWDELSGLTRTLKDLSESISTQEPPALEPSLIREQQEHLEAMRDDIESTQFDLDEVHQTGEQLMTLCGEPDKPEVQKNIDDIDTNILTITSDFDKRSRVLEEALEKSMHFQDDLMKVLVWLQKREDKLKEFGPIVADFDKIKAQWNDLKLFKSEVEVKHVDIESLNQQSNELVKESSPDQALVVKEPMEAVTKRWTGLLNGVGDRQRDLQLAMLNVGQFEHAINELLAWLDKTDQTLDENRPVFGDRKQVEIELAKHRVLINDISAHEPSIRSVRQAGQKNLGADKSSTAKRKVDDMMKLWDKVQEKSQTRQAELEESLKEALEFSNEMEKTLVRLGQIEGMLITSRPVGGLPETAREQLEKFMEVHNELQDLEPVIGRLVSNGNRLVRKSPEPSASNIKQNLQLLQQTWEHIKSRSADRKGKLEQAVTQANNFHSDLNTFIAWLTDTERVLNSMSPVSRVIARVTDQIKDQKNLQKDIAKNRDAMIKLDKTGTHLKYFSQKQDVVLIKNLLSSVQQRWEKIVSRSAERTRHLERGYKEAKQFNDMLTDMLGWLTDAERNMMGEHFVGNDPIKIKAQISQHKEFQKALGAKQPIYDNVNRAGRALKERSPEEDIPTTNGMLHDLKNKWNTVCGLSVDRQRKLEEALLTSGQFNDALEALLDWLAKVEPGLGEDQMVHGDIDTVNNLVEEHKAFQQELGARANNVAFVRKRARELLEKADEDTSQQQAQLIELTTMWERVCKLSVNKQERLQQAHKLAEDFHKKAQELVMWLSSAERSLRHKGALPDDEGELVKQIEEHKAFEEEFLRQEGGLRETLNIGQDIMKRCHPDAVSTLKHWLSVLKVRWEEVSNYSRQRGNRLRDALVTLRRNNQLLEELIAWVNGAENKLFNENSEDLPEDAEIIQTLIKEHMDFQNEMSGKQPEIDVLTKSDRRRGMSTSHEPVSQIPLYKGLAGRRTPTPSKYGTQRRRYDDDGRRTPDPHFRNPRVAALHNKWRQVWLMALERQRRLQEALDYLNEVERMKDFKFDDWRKRYLTWMHHNKSRIMDFFRRQDRDRDGKVTRAEFIDGIMQSRFNTTPMEMDAVANIFDRDGDGFIDYKEFVSALRPNRDTSKTSNKKPEPVNDAEMIQDEVKRQVHKCTCVKQYRIHKIGEGKYRFGDSQKLRLVRILRSTVMVRVGGGWMALDEFLVKNDPCRAKGKTNVELREQFTLAAGVSQSMTGFTAKSPSGSSYSGSSTYSGATSPWSARSPSTVSGPVIKKKKKPRPTSLASKPKTYHVRERAAHATPWRQNMARSGPDGEVSNILSGTPGKYNRNLLSSPRHFHSPATPVSRSSSRASTGSRPFSPTGSETSELSEPEVFTTVQSETRNVGGRNETTRTYQTHVVQSRTVNTPARSSSATPTRMSKIPKLTPKKH